MPSKIKHVPIYRKIIQYSIDKYKKKERESVLIGMGGQRYRFPTQERREMPLNNKEPPKAIPAK